VMLMLEELLAWAGAETETTSASRQHQRTKRLIVRISSFS
jgi:hypothetical protein